MKNIYEQCPTYETESFILRMVKIEDAADLLCCYSDRENVNNIETVHLHFGMQLVFDESQKECLSEIWIDVYDIVRLLSAHRSSLTKTAQGWQRVYPYRDLDVADYPPKPAR